MRILTLLFFACFALLTGVRDVWACTCASFSLGAAYHRADVVFIGTITEADTVDFEITARIDVDEVFKGQPPRSTELRTAASGAACGYEWMEPGTSHLFFADSSADGTLQTGLCTGSAPLGWVPETVALLRNATGTSPYVPVSPGNSWTYELAPGGAAMTVRMVDTTVVGDRTYLVITGMPIPSDSIYVDGLGNLGARIDGTDVLMLDFTWTDPFGYYIQVLGEVHEATIERGVTAYLRMGQFNDCIRFRFHGQVEWAYTFAPDVGMILVSGSNGGYYELAGANIKGKMISGTDDPGRPEASVRLDVYPNPFAGEATVNLTLPNPVAARVSVFDARGREVAVLADRTIDGGTTRLFWNVADLPSGVYFVRLVAGDQTLVSSAVRL
ncbi:MAG TPA: T9SS type A sorting domain-containing protein [Rhodothermales bacterium]